MRLQTKITLVSLVSLVAIIALVSVNIWASKHEAQQLKTLRMISSIQQRHMEGAMMHDAIRADVLASLLASSKRDFEGMEEAARNLDEHYKIFEKNLLANLNEPMPEDMKALLDEAVIDLKSYGEKAHHVLDASDSGMPVEPALTLFKNTFESMEGDLEDISHSIEKWASAVEKETLMMGSTLKYISILLSSINIVLIVFLPYYTWSTLFTPQKRMILAMQRLSNNDLTVEIEGQDREDEIGDMADSIRVFKDNALEKLHLEQQQKEIEERSKRENKEARIALAQKFETQVQGIIQGVAAASTELYQTAESMTFLIQEASQRVKNVASAANDTSNNVQNVASAAEQMSASVREIASQVSKSSSVVRSAVNEVDKADQTSNRLGDTVSSIDNVIELIQNITEQINLLALNATIESARAGEAGKGFAVVANEVKNLANQTSKATETISGQVSSIQEVTKHVIEALNAIKTAITSVDEYASAISAAVEEQSATTNDIAANMQRAAGGTNQISHDIDAVKEASDQVSVSSGQVLDAARMLSTQAEQLSQEVDGFLREVRQG